MKIAFCEAFTYLGDVIDTGLLVVDADDDYQPLSAMGLAADTDPYKQELLGGDHFPEVAQVNSLIKPLPMEDIAIEFTREVGSHLDLDGGEEFFIYSRTPHSILQSNFGPLLDVALYVFNPSRVDRHLEVFGVDSMHVHDPDVFESITSRAIRRCVFNHAEFLTYRNNIIGWAQELPPLGEIEP